MSPPAGSMAYPFKQVDVFSQTPFRGNPVAVVFGAEGLTSAEMQQIAAWTNLSETTFVLPATSPDADYRIRIFAPRREMPFAGHPTLGSAHAVIEAGLVRPRDGRLVQQCLAGDVAIRIEGDRDARTWWVTVPRPECTRLTSLDKRKLEAAVGCAIAGDPAIVSVGPRWLVLDAASADVVDAVSPNMLLVDELSHALKTVGVTIFGRMSKGGAAFRVRSFAPAEGVPEDSVCGSGNASVAAYLRFAGRASEAGDGYVASQGLALGRDGLVHVRLRGPDVEIGGCAITCIEGSLRA